MPVAISKPAMERLSQYRRYLLHERQQKRTFVFSHQLAAMMGITASLVRRDIMVTGCMGNPSKGYRIDDLLDAIAQLVDTEEPTPIILVGLGKLGSALLGFFRSRRPNLRIVAAFDTHTDKVGRVYQGTHCYPLDELPATIHAQQVKTAILCVPSEAAQEVADTLVVAGITGLLNFAPTRLYVPANVYVESIDLTTMLEKTVFFARQHDCARD